VARPHWTSIKPAPDELFPQPEPNSGPEYMHFGKDEPRLATLANHGQGWRKLDDEDEFAFAG
jgi:hypothetical protein